MWRSRRAAWAGLAVAILTGALALSPLGSAGPAAPTHPRKLTCNTCHLGASASEVPPEAQHRLVASQELLCGRCHPKSIQVSHPSGFLPARALPAGYPLDWKGDLTCSTCHQVHDASPGRLRGDKRGRQLCLSCHEQKFFQTMRDGGTSTVQSGHLAIAATEAEPGGRLDSFSLQCMGCHNRESDETAPTLDRNMVIRHGRSQINHPVGRTYAQAANYGGYRSPAQISRAVLLPDGKVSCVSCHEGYSRQHGRLVMSNAGSALCLECHAL